MAEKKTSKEEKTEQLAEKTAVAPSRKSLLIGLSVAGVLLMIVLAIGTSLLFNALHQTVPQAQFGRLGMQDSTGSGMYRQHGGRFGQQRQQLDSGTRLQGVVISVDGESFVVAGNGKQVTVKKTASTTFQTADTTVAVNDTVIVIGTTGSDGAMTATMIALYGSTPAGTNAS